MIFESQCAHLIPITVLKYASWYSAITVKSTLDQELLSERPFLVNLLSGQAFMLLAIKITY